MIRAALTAFALCLPAPAAAQPLEGTWLGFGATAILLGFTVPVVEELTITGDLASQRGWTVVDPAACTGLPDQPPACAGAVDLGGVRLVMTDGARLSARPEGVQTNPHVFAADADYWPQFRLAGHDWLIRTAPDALVLTREAQVGDDTLTIERLYLRAPAGTGAALFDYLTAMGLSIGRAICGLQAIHADPPVWTVFVDHLHRLAPVTADLAAIDRLPTRPRAVHLRRMTLMRGPEEMGELAGFVDDIPETARQAWLDHVAWVEAGSPAPEGLVTLPMLGFPAAPATLARAEACLEYFGAY